MFTPSTRIFTDLFESAFRASLVAGTRIMEIYNSDNFNVSMKSDNSPLSSADKDAHELIKKHLVNSRIPIISEEGRNMQFEERRSWDIMWIVDPLDGTRQFIQKRGEFTVNIALVSEGNLLFGIIYAPALGDLYFGIKDHGSYKLKVSDINQLLTLPFEQIYNQSLKLPTIVKTDDIYKILVSFYHVNQETLEYIDEMKKKHSNVEVKKVGSSLKMCLLAEGQGDVYIRYTNTYEWDTAAAQAILQGVGWDIFSLDTGNPLTYNKESLLNPCFICKMVD